MAKTVGIVPARYHSTRLEGKALADLAYNDPKAFTNLVETVKKGNAQ